MKLWTRLFALAVTVLPACAPGGDAEEAGDPEGLSDQSEDAIIGGQKTSAYPAVGEVLNSDGPNRANGNCTGTLIAPRLVLTAAHCVLPRRAFLEFSLPGGFLGMGRSFSAERVYAHSAFRDYTPGPGQGNADIALIVLSKDVSGVAPARLSRSQPAVSSRTVHVGYGVSDRADATRNGGSGFTGRTKRVGNSTVTSKSELWFKTGRVTCAGDSGGPALDANGAIVGLTSRSDDCVSWGMYVSVPGYRPWIDQKVREAGLAALP